MVAALGSRRRGRGDLGEDNGNTRANATNGASTVSLRNRSTLVLVRPATSARVNPSAEPPGYRFVLPPSA